MMPPRAWNILVVLLLGRFADFVWRSPTGIGATGAQDT
jgi:hypothetical protein